MIYLYAVRHTKIQNSMNLCYGQREMDLCDTFEYEAMEILKNLQSLFKKKTLKTHSPTQIFTSPSLRCRKLASFLSQHLKLDLEVDNRILEFHFGDWEGVPWDLIPESELKDWMCNFVNRPPNGGESMSEFQKRVRGFLNFLKGNQRFLLSEVQTFNLETYPPEAILVTHSGVIRMINAIILGYPLENFFKFEVRYGKIYEFLLSLETQQEKVF